MYSIRNSIIRNCLNRRWYTVFVERLEKIPPIKKELDPRKFILKPRHFHYKFVECTHNLKWGSIDLILTDYIEGIGHKGEIVNVPRHTAYYDLLPTGLAVYVTDEYLELFKKDRESASKKAKVSPYASKTQQELENLLLEIPMNTSVEWTLNKDNVRLALRYKKIVSENENIIFPEGLEVTSRNYMKFTEPFLIEIKIIMPGSDETYIIESLSSQANKFEMKFPHYATGLVVKGFGRGSKQLGIPTANYPDEVVEKLPECFNQGVYYGYAQVENGPVYKMVMSIGTNPYYNNEKKTMETYIMNQFADDFYGSILKTVMVGFVRTMTSFKSLDDLIAAIHNDIDVANKELDKPENEVFKTAQIFSKL